MLFYVYNQGPVKSDDELPAGEMNYGCYLEITNVCTGKYPQFNSLFSFCVNSLLLVLLIQN